MRAKKPDWAQRAEQLVDRLDTLARVHDEFEFGLSELAEERVQYIQAVMAFAREEQARERDRIIALIHESHWFHTIKTELAKQLREEGRS